RSSSGRSARSTLRTQPNSRSLRLPAYRPRGVGTIDAEVPAPHRRRQMAAQLRMARRDPLEGALEALRHRDPRALPVRGCRAPPLRPCELLEERLDLFPEPLRSAEIVPAFRLLQLLAQLRQARPVLVARAGVEDVTSVAEVGAGGEFAVG